MQQGDAAACEQYALKTGSKVIRAATSGNPEILKEMPFQPLRCLAKLSADIATVVDLLP